MQCAICGVELHAGEPIVITENGPAHRFKNTCEWELAAIAELTRIHECPISGLTTAQPTMQPIPKTSTFGTFQDTD